MQIFDTHCHYNMEPLYSGKPGYFFEDKIKSQKKRGWKDHWQQAQAQGVTASLIPGASLSSSKDAIQIAQQEENLFAAAAIHPGEINKTKPSQLKENFQRLKEAVKNSNVVAVGETGLDYFHLPEEGREELVKIQKQLFIDHILLANDLKKPLIIHARDYKKNQGKSESVYDNILNILKTHYQFYQPFVLHCVSGPKNYVQQALDLGAYISFAGNITYPSAGDLRQLFKLVPKDKLLIETDAPFLAPQKYRGQINEPHMITQTAEFISNKFNINLNQVLQNSCQFYNLNSDEYCS